MNYESYEYLKTSYDLESFIFVSKGNRGNILKGVFFKPTDSPTIFNMVFGDVEPDGNVDDFVVSDNGDRDKILATLAKIITIYIDKYPQRAITIQGSTKERNRLYRMAINLNFQELSEKFDFYARENENMEFIPFQKNMNITTFLIKRKF